MDICPGNRRSSQRRVGGSPPRGRWPDRTISPQETADRPGARAQPNFERPRSFGRETLVSRSWRRQTTRPSREIRQGMPPRQGNPPLVQPIRGRKTDGGQTGATLTGMDRGVPALATVRTAFSFRTTPASQIGAAKVDECRRGRFAAGLGDCPIYPIYKEKWSGCGRDETAPGNASALALFPAQNVRLFSLPQRKISSERQKPIDAERINW